MCRKLIFVTSFVLVLLLFLTNVTNAGSPIIKLDINQTNTPAETEEDFISFTIADSGSQVDGITVEFGGTLDSRRRDAPTGVPFEQIYRDFIFSRPGAMTITLSGLAANTTYEITIYAWDTVSEQTRVADWTANGIFVCKTEFDGTQDPPTAEDDYAFTGKATADSTGTILLESTPGEGTREISGASHPFAFLNALVVSSSAPITMARRPNPVDGTLHEDTWVSLSWTPGDIAVSHDVYLGDNFEDVNDGAGDTFRGNQDDVFYVAGFPGYAYPDGLAPGTTYYWRIDEVNDAEPNSPWKGPIWNFSIPPKTAYNPVPAEGAELVPVDAILSWTAGFGAKLHYIVFGEDFDEVNNAAAGVPNGPASYSPGQLKLAKTYYWRVDEFDSVETHKGEVWSFTTLGAASGANPADGAMGVKPTVVLGWDAGAVAASHEVYFGPDADAVKNATTASPEYKGPKALGDESYDPGQLLLETTYYWRIDEVNGASTDSPWAGNVWNFTTGDFFVIDDFEIYDANNQIWYAWHDGLGYGAPGTADYFAGNGTGAAVGDETTASYTEEIIVHSGLQSMPFSYDNNKVGYAMYSEVELMLNTTRDWTEEGVVTLTIWFRGDSANAAENLYVALNGNAVVNNDNPDAALRTSWTQWNIDLTRFADQGVNLTNVTSITLGLGNRSNPVAGGAGMMYFDDIRLYPLEPETP